MVMHVAGVGGGQCTVELAFHLSCGQSLIKFCLLFLCGLQVKMPAEMGGEKLGEHHPHDALEN